MPRMLFLIVAGLLMLTATAVAKDVTYQACTADQKSVELIVSLNDEALTRDHPVEQHVGEAFSSAAGMFSAEDFLGVQGYQAFLHQLDREDLEALDHFGAPTITGDCHHAPAPERK